MSAKSLFRIALLLLGVALSAPLLRPAAAAAVPWSQTLANDARLKNDVGWLDVGQEKVLYLHKPAAGAVQRGTVILLHDRQAHADWPQVIRPLRELLPEHGWATLSLQLPPPAAIDQTAQYESAVGARITAAANWIAQGGDKPIVLLGVGTGATTGAWYLNNTPKNSIWGLVAVSARPLPPQSLQDTGALLGAVDKPVLDVFAERDHPRVLAGAEQRRPLAAQKPAGTGRESGKRPARYRQMLIEGADADYAGQAEALTKRIRGWMQSQFDR